MKITIFGGSGFIGQKLTEELIHRGHIVTSISRIGKPTNLTADWSQKAHWVRSDILKDTIWQQAAKESDWVIDAIGILKENPSKNVTYERFILTPVRTILTYLNTQKKPARFLFLSANNAPFPFRKYMDAKLQAEQLIKDQENQSIIFYPSLVMDKERYSSIITGNLINLLKNIPGVRTFVQGYTPISREHLANEIANVIEGKPSSYTQRQK